MKRILGTVVAAVGVLAFSTFANAAPYSFDVSGTGSVVTVSTFASVPCGGGAAGNCFTSPLSAGSLINLDITAGYVTMNTSTLEIDTVTSILGGTVIITTDVQATLSGATGTMSGDDILWATPASYTTTGTLTCTGPNCALLGAPENVPLPISVLNTLGNTSSVNPIILGTWDLDASLANILGSTRAVTSTSNVNGAPAGWLVFGPTDMGHTVPEPGVAALVLLGLGALSLRSRKA
jgi:hypothetical protein